MVREQMLGPKETNRHRPLFFLTHLFCCGCCSCKICGHEEKNANENVNLPSTPEDMCLISSFTGNLQMSPKFSDSTTYHSLINSDSKQRLRKQSAAFFKTTENGLGQSGKFIISLTGIFFLTGTL
ncbi:hypothetical protein ACH3XW_6735 [Acanthocheilonema viteae]